MKAGLKRIEATLHDLGTHGTASAADSASSTKQSFSFRISVGSSEATAGAVSSKEGVTDEADASELGTEFESHCYQNNSVQTFRIQDNDGKSPALPKFKTPSFTSHRNAANPALALNLLQEIQESVSLWQKELQKIVKQIQDIYIEGPIVNGWLESQPQESEPGGTATLRHAEVDRLMDYVEEICAAQENVSFQSPRTGYRLCGLDSSGQVWSRPCPPDQVATVSMAIARYQKLRQLLGRKQYLETRLSQLAETLVVLHSHIQQG
jgi:hypothetical protein